MREYPVDPDRVYLAGIVEVPTGVWNGHGIPYCAASVVTFAYPGGDVSHAAELANIPIWAFHSRDETYIPVISSEEMVAALKNAGVNILSSYS